MRYTYLLLLTLGFGMAGIFQSKAQCPISNTCTPGNASNSTAGIFGGGIYQVKIGTTFVNNSGGATDGYKEYCSLGAINISLGAPFSIYVKTGNNIAENLKVFIDVNNDQNFSVPDEQFFLSTNSKVHSGLITIPSGVTGQQIKLRITSDLINSANLPGPCSTPEFSQVEDYAIILQQNVNPPVAQFKVSDTLTCSGLVTFTDQSVNNPTSWSWSFGDGEFSTQQSPQHQYLTPGLFSVKLKVSSANGVDSLTKENFVRFNDTVPVAASCSPVTINQCCGYGISRFVLNTIDNSSSLGSYQNFTCTNRTTLLQGRSYPIQIGTNPNQNQDTRIWIDYNNNGSFEATEMVFESLNTKNPVGNIIISNDTSVKKNKALRLRIVSEFTGGVVNPCSNLDKGQCEDYTVFMKENTLPPVASFEVLSQDFCQPTFNFNSTSTNVILFYHWYFGDGTDTVTLGGSVSHTYAQPGVFNVSLVAVGPFGQDSVSIQNAASYFGAPVASCTLTSQAGGPQFGTGIAEVAFGTIFNRTGNATEGYQDYTCSKQTTVLVGQKVPLTVRNSGVQVEKVRVWIDWNKNGTLETSEIVMDSQSDTVHSALVTIPANATVNGTLRMRVASNFQNAGQLNACGTIQLGQAEDYGVIAVANSVKPTPVFGVDKTLSCTGIVQFSDSSTNLPSSWLWKFGDGQTSTEPSPIHTYNASGVFTVTLIVSNEFGTDSLVKTNYIQITNTTGMVSATCIPPANTTCCQYGIEQVIFAGINQTSQGASEGYKDFTCGTIGSAPIGTSQSITIVNSGTNPENAGVWIDWNNDGAFADAELVFSSTGATSHGGTIAIPGNAPAGVGLRMRVVSDFINVPLAGPCGPLQFGQVEDYQIILQGNNQAPVSLFSANDLVSCSGVISFQDTSFNAPTSWKWYFGDGDSSIVRNPVHTYSQPGVYTVKLIVSNATGSDTVTKIDYILVIDGKNLKPAQCQPQTVNLVNNQGVGIRSVVFNTINRQSATAPTESYVDASCTNRTTLFQGATYPITVLTNTNFPESCRAWIDWNNNGVFEDPSERILNGQNAQSHTSNVLVPATAILDTALRMRVISDFGGGGPGANILPCNNPNFGQCEDYAVVVQQVTTPPSAHFTAIKTTSCNGFIQFADSSLFLPTSWLWNFGDGQTATTKNPSHQYSNTGTYTVRLKVSNAFGSDSVEFLNYVTISALSGPRPSSCTNTVAAPGATNGTTRVRFGNLDKTSGLGGADGGYLDYTCSDSALVTMLTTTQANALIINTSSGATRENCRVFIDYNNNGQFETNESVLNSQNNNVHTANLVLNQNQCLGVPVRMRVITENRFNQINNACYNPTQGQVEDYRVRLVYALFNPNPPIAKIYAVNSESCNGYIQFRDSSSFIPTSWLWSFGDGQTSTAQNPLHLYSSTGSYNVKLKVTNANGSDSISILNFVTVSGFSGPKPVNCTNTVANPSATNGTTLVQFGNLSKVSGFSADDGGYLDYSCTDSATITITTVGQTNAITINTSSGNTRENCRVYIDYNNDGVFATNESVFLSQNNIVHTGNIIVSAAQSLGVPVRMRVICDTRNFQIISACYNPVQGQVEDYRVRFVWAVPNLNPPVAKITSLQNSSCNGFIQFKDSSAFFPTSWNWSFGDGQTSTLQNPLHQYNSTGTYDVKLKVANANGVDSVTRIAYVTITNTNGPVAPACVTTTGAPGFGNGTTRVRFGTLDRTSGLAGQDGGYNDYICSDSGLVAVVNQTQGIALTVNTSAGNTLENCSVYIDFNNDGVLTDAELVMSSLNNNVHTKSVLLTQAQCTGIPVRMRVMTDSRLNTISSGCYNPQNGQVEDYTVRLVWAVSTQDLITENRVTVYPNPSTGEFRIRTNGNAIQSWYVYNQQGKQVASGSENEGSYDTFIQLHNLPSGIYQLRVKSENQIINQKIVVQK